MKHYLLCLTTSLLSTVALAQDPAPAAPAPAEVVATAPAPLQDIQQVQMHVWISETSEQGLRDLGTNLVYKRIADNHSDSLQQVNSSVFNPNNPSYTVTLPAPSNPPFQPTLRNDTRPQGGAGLNFSLIETDHGDYDGVFRAIDQSTDVDFMSKPELLVINNMAATIHAGGEVPFQTMITTKGATTLGIEFKPIGVQMVITPIISTDNLIQLDITNLDVTDISRVDQVRGLDLPIIAKRSQTGSVLVPNGQAMVIGGLSNHVNRTTERRVPIIGKVPVLGALFRSRVTESDNSTLLIFVAPTVVDLRNLNAESTNAMEFWREGSWRSEDNIANEIELLKENY